MKIYTTINPDSLSNIYLVKSDNNNSGVLIDPGSFSQNVYQTIKRSDIDVKKIIITHSGPEQINGIPLLKKIFNAEIFAYDEIILDYETVTVRNDSLISLEEMQFRIIETPVHTYDSISILTKDAIFIGDIFQAGSLSSFIEKKEPTHYEFNIIKNKILSLPDNLIIYPGQGPATTMELERKFNPYFINL